MKKRRGHVLVLVVLLAIAAAAIAAPSASAVVTTRINYMQSSTQTVQYAVAAGDTENLTIETYWWRMTDQDWGKGPTGSANTPPVYPDVVVNTVVQMDNGTNQYADIDVGGLYAGSNAPDVGNATVDNSAGTGPQYLYLDFLPTGGNVHYRCVVTSDNTARGVNGVTTYTGTLYSQVGEVDTNSTGSLVGTPFTTVMAWWRGTYAAAGGDTSATDVFANWDDYIYDTLTGNKLLIDAWANYDWEPTAMDAKERATNSNTYRGYMYTIEPEIWTPAKRVATVPHNTWGYDGTAYAPEPGNLDWKVGDGTNSAAPLYHTMSWSVLDTWTDYKKVGYTIGHVETLNASGLGYEADATAVGKVGAKVVYRFFGSATAASPLNAVTWKYIKSPYGGNVGVSIDGVAKTNVDQYSATWNYAASTDYTGLGNGPGADGWHVITLTNLGSKNAGNTSVVCTMYHDAFVAHQSSYDTTFTTSEGAQDGNTGYEFATATDATSAQGYSWSRNKMAASAFAFTGGPQVRFNYMKSPTGCIAEVTIDGKLKGTIDMSAATMSTGTIDYTALGGNASTVHVILVKNTGKRGSLNTTTKRDLYINSFQYGASYVTTTQNNE